MISVVLLDIDGVLTDGAVTITPDGAESKRIRFDDVDAIFSMKRAGLKLGFITAEDSPFVGFVRNRFEPDYVLAGCKDKLAGFQDMAGKEGLKESEVCFVGDSAKDIALLDRLDVSFCPSDVPVEVRAAAKTVLSVPRGGGVVAEVARRLLSPPANSDAGFYLSRVDEHIMAAKALRSDGALLDAISEAGRMLAGSLGQGGRLLICGNGGSAADAQHIATELVSRFLKERRGLAAEALSTNTSSLTAIGNDYGFERVFSRQVEAQGNKGDVLVGISTSGNSHNVALAMKQARTMGISTIGLIGQNMETAVAAEADCVIAVPSGHTPVIQECHIMIGHMLCEYIENKLFPEVEA